MKKEIPMSLCKHLYVRYLGKQETLIRDKYLELYQCLECGSTITLNGKPQSRIIQSEKSKNKLYQK